MQKLFKFCLTLTTIFIFSTYGLSGCGGGGGNAPDGSGGDSPSSEKQITEFSFKNPPASGNINKNTENISIYVPPSTDLTQLIATFKATGVSVKVGGVDQQSDTTVNDFTNPVTYTVTAEDGSVANYKVTVTKGTPPIDTTNCKSPICSFSIGDYSGSIDETVSPKTITVYMAKDTDVTALIAQFTTIGTVKVGNTEQVSGITGNDFTNPVTYKVVTYDYDDNYIETFYTVTVITDSTKITSFSLDGYKGKIDENLKTIEVYIPTGTNQTSMAAEFATIGKSVQVGGIEQQSGTTANDFTNTVTYTITGSDNKTADYTVKVYPSDRIISLKSDGIVVDKTQGSIIVIPVHATTKTTSGDVPLQNLQDKDFTVLEDGVANHSESDFETMPFEKVPYIFNTVFAVDISPSITPEQLKTEKNTLKNYVENMLPNQKVAIYTFADSINLVQNFTSDPIILNTAIDKIPRGIGSTKLYDAIRDIAGKLDNSFSFKLSTYNSLVFITDGEDTADKGSKEEAKQACENKICYAVPVGDINKIHYEELVYITGKESNVLKTNDFTSLGTTLDNMKNSYLDNFKGFYYVNYISPSRAKTHTIELAINDNKNFNDDRHILDEFNAEGFTSVKPYIKLICDNNAISENETPPMNIIFGTKVICEVTTSFSNDTKREYDWKFDPKKDSDPEKASPTITPLNAGKTKVELTALNTSGKKNVTLIITDKNWESQGVSRTQDIMVNAFKVSGNVSGLLTGDAAFLINTTKKLDIKTNKYIDIKEEIIAVSKDRPFEFNRPVIEGYKFDVTIKTQPKNRNCSVSNGSRTMGNENVTNVTVTCTPK